MKKVFVVEDLDCAACAAKIENAVNELDEVKNASVSYMAQRMTVETVDGADFDAVMKKIVIICKKTEPDMTIVL